MTVAVTGATGFVGKHVIAELEKLPVSIVLVCRPTTVLPMSFVRHSVVRIETDELNEQTFQAIGEPDTLIHLAWAGLPNYRSRHHFENELPTQYRFLRRVIEGGLKNLLVTGTCFEYGMQSGPLAENLDTRPENPYGFAKDGLRRQLCFLKQELPFRLTWTRLFYTYGSGQSEGSLFTQLCLAVQRGDATFNMSGGEQLRDYLPIEDVAKCLVELALANQDVGPVNVCSGHPISVRRLVETWIQRNKWTITPNFGHYPYPDYEPMAFWGDRTKLNLCLEAGGNKRSSRF